MAPPDPAAAPTDLPSALSPSRSSAPDWDSAIALPPTQAELPYDDGEPMESERHKLQMDLLIEGGQAWLKNQQQGYVGGNMFVYFSLAQVRNRDFKGARFFCGARCAQRRATVLGELGRRQGTRRCD